MAWNGGRSLVSQAGLALLLGWAAGCSASSQWMHPATTPRSMQAPPDQALVVVMRPSDFGSAVRFTVVDDQGRFLGQPLATSYYVLRLPPGRHTFVAWAENADMVEADLAPGKVYYLLASVRLGVWSARVALTALTPHAPEWGKRDEWLAGSEFYTVDLAGGTGHLAREEADDVQANIAEAKRAWAQYDAGHRDERTLRPADGQ